MPNRARNHILEDLSRDALRRRLVGPLGWVVRDIASDYGVDVEVEIFDPDGQDTGLTFKVQLKGMEESDRIGPFRDIKIDHLQYWGRMDVPVLLVAFDESTGKIYGRWIHSLDLALRVNQKTKRVRFDPEHEINDGDPRLRTTTETVRRLKSGQFGRPFPVRLDGTTAQAATHEFFDVIRNVGLQSYLRLDRSTFAFAVSLSDTEVRVALPGEVGSLTLSSVPVGTLKGRLGDALVMLAALLSRLNRFGESAQLMRRLVGTCSAPNCLETAFEIAVAAHEIDDSDLLVDLSLAALDARVLDAAQIYLVALCQLPGNDWLADARKRLDPALLACVDSAVNRAESSKAAFWAYNYAQLLFGKGARADARSWVNRALELDPSGYGTRPEPQRLLGAIAWHDGDMTTSVQAYQAAVDKGGVLAAGSALADSLMHAGQYERAHEVLGEVFRAGSTNWRDWFVDAILDEIIEDLGLRTQERRQFPPVGTILSGRTPNELSDFLKEGDALNPAVWLARCIQSPSERLTTLMAGAYLSSHPFLMAAAISGLTIEIEDQGLLEDSFDRLVEAVHDNPEARVELLADQFPLDPEVRALVEEFALRGLELPPTSPGVQLVDENNIVQSSVSPDEGG